MVTVPTFPVSCREQFSRYQQLAPIWEDIFSETFSIAGKLDENHKHSKLQLKHEAEGSAFEQRNRNSVFLSDQNRKERTVYKINKRNSEIQLSLRLFTGEAVAPSIIWAMSAAFQLQASTVLSVQQRSPSFACLEVISRTVLSDKFDRRLN